MSESRPAGRPLMYSHKRGNEYALALYKERIDNFSAITPPDERLAIGLAMIYAGATVVFASQTVNIKTDTLRNYANREGLSLEARRERFAAAEEQAVVRAFDILERAMAKAEQMLVEDSMRPSEVVKLIQATTSLLSSKLRWGAPDPEPMAPQEREKTAMEKLLEKMEAGQKVSVEFKETEPDPPYQIAEVVGTSVDGE